jgi:hypothetical protein
MDYCLLMFIRRTRGYGMTLGYYRKEGMRV